MGQVLDIVALRSLVAVADCGGFHRAGSTLRISQSAVSQHVRRLEKVIGRPLVERRGRQAGFTADGQLLLIEARRILAAHDETLRRLVGDDQAIVAVGATEHAAELVLPAITTALGAFRPARQVRFRIDRTARLNDAIDRGALDLAVFMAEAASEPGVPLGALPLVWYSAAGWEPPQPGRPWPLVAIEEPCLLRRRALESLAARGHEPYVVCDAGYLAGVLDAVRAGLGVALIARTGATPEGLVARDDLPAVPPAPLGLRPRRGADPAIAGAVVSGLRGALGSRAVDRAA
jgi:DNA-binding transcriptional LysR family regulator